MARPRDRREGGRVNVYLSPEGMVRLEAAAEKMFPGRQRTDGLVIEAALKALVRDLMRQDEAEQKRVSETVAAAYQQVMNGLGARFEDALDPSGERDPEADI